VTKIATLPIAFPSDEIAIFCRRWGIVELALFGSALRPDFHAGSDVDVLATFAPHRVYTLAQYIQMQDELAAIFGRSVDIVDRQAVKENANYIRRRAILDTTEVIYAPG
jgi:predicted nucleotidyltransferase